MYPLRYVILEKKVAVLHVNGELWILQIPINKTMGIKNHGNICVA